MSEVTIRDREPPVLARGAKGVEPMRRAVRLTLLGLLLAAPARGQAPGPETFAKPPQTPMELWDAVDYLVRTGQPAQAVPYLNAFLNANPNDEVLLQIRDRYGSGPILRLADYPETRAAAGPLLKRFNDAAARQARDPERLAKAVAALTKTSEEQRYALDQLRRAGPYAVPAVLEELSKPGLAARDRGLIVQNLARLDHSATPALVAALDAPDETVAADIADVLGRLGDPRAIPFLLYPAATVQETVVREPARRAIARLTGRPYAALTPSALRQLTAEARRYLTGHGSVPAGPTVELWTWDGPKLVPKVVSVLEAEGYLGLKLARQALQLDPTDHEAEAVMTALVLQQAIDRVGLEAFPAQDPLGAYPLALSVGPHVLNDVLRLAMQEGLGDLGAATATILGLVTNRDNLMAATPELPLVQALAAPDRRTRFAAAQALVGLEPIHNFPGANRVVPVLTQFLGIRSSPRAVIVDGDGNRANTVGSVLQDYGYDFTTANNGPAGFRLAAEGADVEAIFIEPTVLQGAWKTRDLVANLRADAATAAVPIFVYGPQAIENKLSDVVLGYPRVAFVVTPTDSALFKPVFERALHEMGMRPLTNAERAAYSQHAAALLAAIATRPGNPYEPDLPAAERALATALNHPPSATSASVALGDVPSQDAQRSLADIVLEPGKPAALRLRAASDLARSLQRFGPLVTADQETRLLAEFDAVRSDPALKAALAEVLGALRPHPAVIGPRLRNFNPASVLASPSPAPPAGKP